MIVGGAIVRTPLLNFICGPAAVIAIVTMLPPLLERGRRDDEGGQE